MRKLSVIIIICALVISCVEKAPKKAYFNSESQNEFYNKVIRLTKVKDSIGINSILINEITATKEKNLEIWLDSIKLFTNWTGKISGIGQSQGETHTNLRFKIEFPEGASYSSEMKFHINYIVHNDSLQNDLVYNNVKGMSNFTSVYFDGFVKRYPSGGIKYDYVGGNYYDSYEFNILSISENPIKEHSKELDREIEKEFEIIDILKDYADNKITDKEFKNKVDKNRNDSDLNELNDYERNYVLRLRQQLIRDFLK